jgi:hypothetical protein
MREHVKMLVARPGAPIFLIVDHAKDWESLSGAYVYGAAAEWWTRPAPVAIFRGANPREVAQLAIDVGWSVYVDDEIDGSLDDWKTSPLREIVKRGRHLPNKAGRVTAVSAMIATHRPSNLPSDIVGTFDRVYLGKLQSYNDADRVHREGWIGGTRTVVETRATLESRVPGDFSMWP